MKRCWWFAPCALLWAAPARADLSDEAERLVAAYRQAGAVVVRLPPLFLTHGQTRPLPIALEPSPGRPCLTVVGLSARSLSFTLEHRAASAAAVADGDADGPASDDDAPPANSARQSSDAGVAVVGTCGARLDPIAVTMTSPRGAIEIIAISHAPKPPAVEQLLPERAEGPIEPQGDVGAPLSLAPLPDRIARATAAARLDGAAAVVPIGAALTGEGRSITSADGTGALVLKLSAGCHRLALLADASAAGTAAVDLDAEVRLPPQRLRGSTEPLRADRSHAPDARLDFCLGAATTVQARWAGAAGRRPVTLLDGYWPLAPGIARVGDRWSDEERAAMAWALFKRGAPAPRQRPLAEWLGLPGATEIPIATEPGACYLAALGVSGGPSAAARLTVFAGGAHYDDASVLPRGAAVTFCSQEGRARALVELRAGAGRWRLALWRIGSP